MGLFAAFVFLLYVVSASRDSFTINVNVQEGEPFAVLPCQYDQKLEELVTVKWSRHDLNPNTVHQRREGDDLHAQNQLFKGRTSMISDALDSGNFSLTLSEPQVSDSGIYICSMIDEEEAALSEVQLHVRASQDTLIEKVEVYDGRSFVLLPCQYSQKLEEMVTVKWSRFDLNPNTVHQRREGDDLQAQNKLFKGRTSMRSDALDSGDFSLTLRELHVSDSGNYICIIIDEEDKETKLSEVQLFVKGIPTWIVVLLTLMAWLVFSVSSCLIFHFTKKSEIPNWAGVLLVLLVLVVILTISGYLLFHFLHMFKSEIPTWTTFLFFLLFFLANEVGLLLLFQEKFVSKCSTWSKVSLVLWALLFLVVPAGFLGLLFHFRNYFILEFLLHWYGVVLALFLLFDFVKRTFHFHGCLSRSRAFQITLPVLFLLIGPGVISLMALSFPFFSEIPTWVRIFLILLVLLLITIDVAISFHFRQHSVRYIVTISDVEL